MYTYQDLEKIIERNSETELAQFVRNVITHHENSDEYRIAKDAELYYAHKNVTISEFKKLLYTVTGKAVPDNYNANYKMASKFFYRFVTQENQYLLSNGVTWKESTGNKLGNERYDFDTQLQKAGRIALIEGVAYGFWNLDHVDIFKAIEFAPLFDEFTGALRAGVRFWQIDKTKPLRATLYEEDGYTEYAWSDHVVTDKYEIMKEKTPYVIHTQETTADGIEIVNGTNYPTFPIVPFYGNPCHQSELVGLREQIDCYDLIKSGFANTVDEASIIYWTLQNAGGMDEVDLAKFVERIKTIHAVTVDDDVKAESHTLDAPFEARETLLDRLRADLYEDAMALDTKALASGGSVVTAVIKSAYEPLDSKTNDYEYEVLEFVKGIMSLAGVKDTPTFTRSKIINAQEEIGVVISAANYLTSDYITTKVLTLLGDGDQAEEMLSNIDQEELDRFGITQNGSMNEENNLPDDSDEL